MEKTILDAIGNTPMVEIKKLCPNSHVRIFAKLEYFNPGGSTKDRAALFMIEAGEQTGELTREKSVIEATSGNTGIGLALVCSVKGYRLLLAMSESVSVERQKILKARGAEILLTPGHLGTDGAIEEVYRMARENPGRYFMTDQFNNEANWKSHYFGTAMEIWEQTEGEVSAVVATLGTTGTLMGVSRRMKELNPEIRIIGVEPYFGHKIQGLKNMKESYCPEIYDKRRLDQKVNIEDEEAYDTARRLAKEEGIFVGMSSGAAMAVALREAETMSEGTLVVILPDGGERYLSTPLFAVKEKVELQLFNALSRRKEPFEPITSGKASIYSCGPTAHARIHLGECRRFVFADLLCRYLAFRGYAVDHVVNITDLDDKTIAGSESAGVALSEFTQQHCDSFKQDIERLGVRPADRYPVTSEHIDDMVNLAERLVKSGYAYEKLRSLYFNISRISDYGKLSGMDIEKVRLGATVDLEAYEKDNPRDFTLLKRSKLSELKRGIYTKTKWGNVLPSWHIQSVAISMKYLGETFDLHTSSRELDFPHHENELAIARALSGKSLARYWMHCERVLVDGKKIGDKTNALTLQDLIDRSYTGREIRYWLISSHYRKPIAFSMERIEDSRRSLKRFDSCLMALRNLKGGQAHPELDQIIYDLKQGFISAMDDDLNIFGAMASIFRTIKHINMLIRNKQIDSEGANKILDAFRNINTVLNVFDFGEESFDPDIQALIQERENARKEKNWELADRIREQLRVQGIVVKDNKIAG
jgi:cysteinyl-tRNA synthetase